MENKHSAPAKPEAKPDAEAKQVGQIENGAPPADGESEAKGRPTSDRQKTESSQQRD